MLNEIEKGQLAITTVQCFTNADGSLANFPGLLKKVIRERVWERRSHHGRLIELPNLRALITLSPIQGWGQDPRKIEAVIKDDPEAMLMYREEMKEQGKRHDLGNNIPEVERAHRGTSRAYSIGVVQRECDHDTVAKVMAGKISPNKALVDAGLRANRQVYINKSMSAFAKKLYEVMSKEDFEQLKKDILKFGTSDQCTTPTE